MTVELDNALSSPDAADMAAAKIAATSNPARPIGMCAVMKVGNT